MSRKPATPLQYRLPTLVVLFSLLLTTLAGCRPAASITAATTEVVAETQAVLTPALEASPTVPPATPTPSGAACPLPEPRVWNRAQGDFCLIYPEGFTLDEGAAANQQPEIRGPARDASPDPVQAFLDVETRPVPPGADLGRMVAEYLTGSAFQGLPWMVTQSQATLGGEPAIVIEGVPGLGTRRQVLALHEGILYTLTFGLMDVPQVATDLEDLYGVVMWSFTFLEGGPALLPAPLEMVSWSDLGHTIRLNWDPSMAMTVDTWPAPAVPLSADRMYAEAHPTFLKFRFLGYTGGQGGQLPYPIEGAQFIAMPTSEFAGFTTDGRHDFPQQRATLQALLQDRPDLATQCTSAAPESGLRLPFLPWVNSAQVFCTRPEYLEFQGGSGIRYLTAFSQGIAELSDPMLFYTFQGLSTDGEIYLAGVFPVRSGQLPDELTGTPDLAAWPGFLAEALQKLNAAPLEAFTPSLQMLDSLVAGIEVE